MRLSRSDTSGVENLGGWLTTVVGRVCLDMLRSRRSRREEPLDQHSGGRVPGPIVDREGAIDPEHEALLADSVGLALLVVLETLTPAKRLAFVLHDMFRRALRGDRPHRGPLPQCDQDAREPGTPPGAGSGRGPRRRSHPPERDCRRLPRRLARRRLRSAPRGTRPGRRAPRRRRGSAGGRLEGGPRRRPWPTPSSGAPASHNQRS